MATRFVFQDQHFTIEAVHSPAIPGYLILRPVTAVTHLSDLPADALSAFGPLLAKAMDAITQTVHPERIYVIRLGEEVEAIHFHLFPRSRAMLDLYATLHPGAAKPSGAFLFDWIRQPAMASQLGAQKAAQEAISSLAAIFRIT